MSRRFEERKGRGHGCIGFFVTLFLVIVALVLVLAFTTDVLDAYKNKVYAYFYPKQFSDTVEACAEKYQVDEDLIYAVIRTESGFREDAESNAGAMGLMQLMPQTFDWLQNRKDGEVTLSSSSLLDGETNIEYGTYLLSILLSMYEDENTAVAAYNAGFSNVDNWLQDPSCSADGKTLSKIPFSETEKYVDRVENTKQMYEKIYQDQPDSQ